MTVNRKPTGLASTIPAGLASGALAAVAATLAGTAVTAKLINAEVMAWDKSGYAVLLILLLASWLGAVVAAGRIKRQRLAMCLSAGLIYFGILMLMTALFFGGQYSGVGETGLLIFCGSMLGVFTGYGGKTGRKRQKFRLHNR